MKKLSSALVLLLIASGISEYAIERTAIGYLAVMDYLVDSGISPAIISTIVWVLEIGFLPITIFLAVVIIAFLGIRSTIQFVRKVNRLERSMQEKRAP